MISRLNPSIAVDVTLDAGLAAPAVMLIVQSEVVGSFPDLAAYVVPPPAPLPQDPGPNGVFLYAPSMAVLESAAPGGEPAPWTLFIDA